MTDIADELEAGMLRGASAWPSLRMLDRVLPRTRCQRQLVQRILLHTI